MSAVLCRFVNTRGQRGTYFRRWFPSISVGVRLVLARQKTRLALSNLPANRDPRRPQSRLVWIDGGWGVDALLGHQTRKHDDLDVAVHHSNLSTLCNLLEDWGYRHVPSGGSWGCNFVLANDQGHRIDVHSFEIDNSGENTFGVAYRGEHLTGAGMIDGFQVRCVAPDWMVKFHTGYPLDKNDFLDVKALCEKFEIEMPEKHQAYWDFLAKNIVRSETTNDYDAIREIHRLAFAGPAEAKLVDDLRQSGDGIISRILLLLSSSVSTKLIDGVLHE